MQKARKGYKAIGDVSYQVDAIGAMALLKSNLGEWSLALQHFQEALEISKDAKDEYFKDSFYWTCFVMIDC